MTQFNHHFDMGKATFLETEKSLSKKTGIDIKHPIRVFSLKDIGVDQNALLDLLSANVPHLHWDQYDFRKSQLVFLSEVLPEEKPYLTKIEQAYYIGKKDKQVLDTLLKKLTLEQSNQFNNLRPHRRRSICQFILTKVASNWQVERIYEDDFTQDVGDYRLEERVFQQSDENTTKHPAFQSFLKALANLTAEFRPAATKIKMVAHEMSVIATDTRPGNNSPEGIHQDGSEFIVSAMVIKRAGILEGRSHIYGPDKSTIYLDYILQQGEGVFQADKGTDMWHRVTSFHKDPNYDKLEGERSILGFDIDVLE